MIIFPAIDIRNGKCVRLKQGLLQQETVYGDPVEMALKWQEAGSKYLHMVDLDGAFTSQSANLDVIEKIVSKLSIPLQLGGGIRTMEDIRQRISIGVSRVILGTVAVKQPELVKEAVLEFGDKIAVGIDARDGKVVIKGWVEDSGISAYKLAEQMKEIGVSTVIYTDISKDGMLTGPNFGSTANMAKAGIPIIASGGVGKLEDIMRLKELGVYGVIVGKALYSGSIEIQDALALQD